jgi:electron transfer flavoprotein alpha subunit
LAKALGGQVGCSRPIAADLKWLSEDHWVGLSGHKVRPKLYLAIGISGQPQHIAGILDSRIIAAINSDPSAPIFQYADYGVVEDLYKIVPILIKKVSELKR